MQILIVIDADEREAEPQFQVRLASTRPAD